MATRPNSTDPSDIKTGDSAYDVHVSHLDRSHFHTHYAHRTATLKEAERIANYELMDGAREVAIVEQRGDSEHVVVEFSWDDEGHLIEVPNPYGEG